MSSDEQETLLCNLIEMYKNMPEFWNVKHPKYKNKRTRIRCYEKLLNEYKKIKNDATMNDLKIKISTMRNCYRRELKKHLLSLTCGEDNIYVPSLWYFDKFSFLRDLESSYPHCDNTLFSRELETQLPSRSNFSSDEIEERESLPVKVQNMEICTNDNRTEFLMEATEDMEFSENNEVQDDASVYSNGWACMLRKMTAEQQLFAKQAIDEIMLLGRINQLALNFLRNIECSSVFGSRHLSQNPASHYSNADSAHFDYEHTNSPTVFYDSGNVIPETKCNSRDRRIPARKRAKKDKKCITKKRIWSKALLENKEQYSNKKLLETLKNSEQKDKTCISIGDQNFNDLLSKVKVYIEKQDTLMREAISAENRLAITLRFLATGDSYTDMTLVNGISMQVISRIVNETCEAIIKVLKPLIKVPKTSEEWMDITEQFYEKSNFPHCIGALDGKHIRIIRPHNSASSYCNYKKIYSVVLMVIADSNSNFLMVDVGANCRNSDADVFSNSKFFKKLKEGELNLPEPQPFLDQQELLPFVFIADAPFALSSNILIPFSHNYMSNDEIFYNKTLKAARTGVENAFNFLTSRFRVLSKTIYLNPEKATTVILACCYLHNYLQQHKISNDLSGETEDFTELLPLDPTPNKDAPTEAQELRQKFCKSIKQCKIKNCQDRLD